MNGLEPGRREALLELAEQLSKTLRSVAVPFLNDESARSVGVPASVVAHAASYLARVRDSGRFRAFLAHFDQLDTLTAQNPDNPNAAHRVLREELDAFLAAHPELSAEDLLYMLSWVRRLLPRAQGENGGPKGRAKSTNDRLPQGAPPTAPARGGQMAAAFERARRKPGLGAGRPVGPRRGKAHR